MIESEILSLIAVGMAAIFGLQGALSLSAKYNMGSTRGSHSSCLKIIFSKEAFFANIPIAYFTIIFYTLILVQLMQTFFHEEIQVLWIHYEIYLALLITFYYAFVMFFKLGVICFGCLRIYLANILMASAITANYFF